MSTPLQVAQHADEPDEVSVLFNLADQWLFKERKFTDAEVLYRRILEIDSTNIDALISIAYCVKYAAASRGTSLPTDLFQTLHDLYSKALA